MTAVHITVFHSSIQSLTAFKSLGCNSVQPSPNLLIHRVAGRELQKWQPDDGADSSSFMMNDDGLGWDQFGVNKTKFGGFRRFGATQGCFSVRTYSPYHKSPVLRETCTMCEASARFVHADQTMDRFMQGHAMKFTG